MRSKISTSSLDKNSYGGRRYAPRFFTKQGIYMLATILKSKVATEVSLAIMDTFVKMRHYINYNKEFLPNRVLLLENKLEDNDLYLERIIEEAGL